VRLYNNSYRLIFSPRKAVSAGPKGKLRLTVRNNDGKPVVGEFSIGVVDEAIYSIYPIRVVTFQILLWSVYDRVSTESSLGFYFSGEAASGKCSCIPRANTPRALAQLKRKSGTAKVASYFRHGALARGCSTDANGHADAQIEFQIP